MRYLFILSIITLFGCGSTENQQSSSSETKKNVIIENADTITIDSQKSVITWIGSKPGGQNDGAFQISEGFILMSNDTIVGGKIKIDMTSVKVMSIIDPDSNKKLTDHLLSEDFFDADSFPQGQFEVTNIIPYDSTKSEFMVDQPNKTIYGQLTLKGITHNVSFPATVLTEGGKIKSEAKFSIDRTLWGITYRQEASVIDKAKDKFIHDAVKVGFYLEAPLELAAN